MIGTAGNLLRIARDSPEARFDTSHNGTCVSRRLIRALYEARDTPESGSPVNLTSADAKKGVLEIYDEVTALRSLRDISDSVKKATVAVFQKPVSSNHERPFKLSAAVSAFTQAGSSLCMRRFSL